MSQNLTPSERDLALARIDKKLDRTQRFMKFFWITMVIVTIIYIVDEIASNMDGKMRTFVIFDLFNTGAQTIGNPAYDTAVSKMNVATIPIYILFFLLPLYKMLADKLGRKLFIVLNTIGMGVGMMLCMIAPNHIVYLVGMVITAFFTPNDAQVIYIMEMSPEKHRAKLCSVTKGIALLSVSLIGVLKSIFYDPNDLGSWRMVFLIPVIIALVVGLSSIFLTVETPLFLKHKRDELLKTEEEKAEEARIEQENKAKTGGIKGAFKYIIHSKQLRWIAIILLIFQVAVGVVGYENENMGAGLQPEAFNNLFHIIEPIVYAIFAFFSGFLSDWLGRKKSCILFGVVGIIGEIGFILCAKFVPYSIYQTIALSVFNGLLYGGLWSLSDCLFLVMPSESTPTYIRASVGGLITYTGGVGKIIGLLVGILFSYIGSSGIGYLQIGTFVPVLIISITLLAIKVKETKGIDMNNVEEELAKR
ncbi:MAG: MFS transporter [Clostridia bacterium]|nr:MFS transporter [Clostridia bacterium]